MLLHVGAQAWNLIKKDFEGLHDVLTAIKSKNNLYSSFPLLLQHSIQYNYF